MRMTNVKFYSQPWRPDNMKHHNEQQHADSWKGYQKLSMDDKKNFFVKNESAEVLAIRSFVQPEATMATRILV